MSVIDVCNNTRVSKWQNSHFWVNYSFKTPFMKSPPKFSQIHLFYLTEWGLTVSSAHEAVNLNTSFGFLYVNWEAASVILKAIEMRCSYACYTQEIVIHCESEHCESILEPQRFSVVTDETLCDTANIWAPRKLTAKSDAHLSLHTSMNQSTTDTKGTNMQMALV